MRRVGVGVIVFNLPHRDARARFAVVLGSEGLVDLSLEGGHHVFCRLLYHLRPKLVPQHRNRQGRSPLCKLHIVLSGLKAMVMPEDSADDPVGFS